MRRRTSGLYALVVVCVQVLLLGETRTVVRVGIEDPVDDDHMEVSMQIQGGPKSMNKGHRADPSLRSRPGTALAQMPLLRKLDVHLDAAEAQEARRFPHTLKRVAATPGPDPPAGGRQGPGRAATQPPSCQERRRYRPPHGGGAHGAGAPPRIPGPHS